MEVFLSWKGSTLGEFDCKQALTPGANARVVDIMLWRHGLGAGELIYSKEWVVVVVVINSCERDERKHCQSSGVAQNEVELVARRAKTKTRSCELTEFAAVQSTPVMTGGCSKSQIY